MDPDRFYHGNTEDEKKVIKTSHLKYHFKLKGLTLHNLSHSDMENKLIRELENKLGSKIYFESFHALDYGRGRVEYLIGFRYDRMAERLKGIELDLRSNGITRLDPTEAFQALEEFRSKRKPYKNRRSRSPKNVSPALLILCPPRGVTDKDILSELNKLSLEETPSIEYIFSNLTEIGGGLIIKLTFQHARTIDELCKTELALKKKPVLILEPSLKHDIEKSVNHAIVHHQVFIENSGEFSTEDLNN